MNENLLFLSGKFTKKPRLHVFDQSAIRKASAFDYYPKEEQWKINNISKYGLVRHKTNDFFLSELPLSRAMCFQTT